VFPAFHAEITVVRAVTKRMLKLSVKHKRGNTRVSRSADRPKNERALAQHFMNMLLPDQRQSTAESTKQSNDAEGGSLWNTLAASVATVAEMASEINGPASTTATSASASTSASQTKAPAHAEPNNTAARGPDSMEAAHPKRYSKQRKRSNPNRSGSNGESDSDSGSSRSSDSSESSSSMSSDSDSDSDSTSSSDSDFESVDVATILKLPIPDPNDVVSSVTQRLHQIRSNFVSAFSSYAAAQRTQRQIKQAQFQQRVESLRSKVAKNRELHSRAQTSAIQLQHALDSCRAKLDAAEQRERETSG